MEDIILPSLTHHAPNEGSQSPTEANETAKRRRLSSFSHTCDSSISWGRRHHHATWLHTLGCASIMVFCPLLIIFYWIALSLFLNLNVARNAGGRSCELPLEPCPKKGRQSARLVRSLVALPSRTLPIPPRQVEFRTAHASRQPSDISHKWSFCLGTHSPSVRELDSAWMR